MDNDAIITKADKGQSLIIIKKAEYDSKVQQFLINNNFQTIAKDPTSRFQREVRKTIKTCPIIIPPSEKWKYTNMNPCSPTIRGLIKIHKADAPIRPIINWTKAPAYRLAKLCTDRLSTELHLPYSFNIRNSVQLMQEIQDICPYNSTLRLASLDITNMYTNIPTKELPKFITNICKYQDTPNI